MIATPTVTVNEIAERLHLSYNHTCKAILSKVRHEKTPKRRILVDELDLRRWLMENSTFTRQTKFISGADYETEEYRTMLAACGLETKCPPAGKRAKLPHQSVKPFDFWDMEILFPDDPRFGTVEQFYRAMYECAAIKIKLGERKTIFVAPALEAVLREKKEPLPEFHVRDINSQTGEFETVLFAELWPAMSFEAAAAYRKRQAEAPLEIRVSGENSYIQKFRDTLADTGMYDYKIGIEETLSNSGHSLHIRVPLVNIDRWQKIVKDVKKQLAKYEEQETEWAAAQEKALREEMEKEKADVQIEHREG